MIAEDIDFVRALVRERTGHAPGRDKAFQIESQLLTVARRHGIEDADRLVRLMQVRPSEILCRDVTEAITGKDSYFFRDIVPFDILRERLLAEIAAKRAPEVGLRVWCAACGTGEEPYSVVMSMREAAALDGRTWEVLATDISPQILEKAKAGLYSQFEIQRGLPIGMLLKYFHKLNAAWQVDASLRARVVFRLHDLRSDPMPTGLFDVVFCRNVLVFFSTNERTQLVDRLRDVLTKDGILILGATESVAEGHGFTAVEGTKGVFRRSET